MENFPITQNEKAAILIMREERPHEVLEIRKDHNGKPDNYFVHRSQKIELKTITVLKIKS